MIRTPSIATAGSQHLLVSHRTAPEASLSPGLCGVALKHLETREIQDVLSLSSISPMSCWRVAIVSF